MKKNSDLLGMGLALESRGICSGQASGPNIFFWVGPPGKLQAPKLDRSQAVGYYKILKTKGKLC